MTGMRHHLVAFRERPRSVLGIETDVGSYAAAGRNGCGWGLWFPAASAPRSIAQ
jgi:hypothetical protein